MRARRPEREFEELNYFFFCGDAMKIRGLCSCTVALLVWQLSAGTVTTADAQTQPRIHLINFYNKYSQWGRLDWTSDHVTYIGDMPVEGAACAFFNSLYAGFSCLDGSVVPTKPNYQRHKPGDQRLDKLAFYSVDGSQQVVVELEKPKLEYRGNFRVDASGKAFFALLWQSYQDCFVKTEKTSSSK